MNANHSTSSPSPSPIWLLPTSTTGGGVTTTNNNSVEMLTQQSNSNNNNNIHQPFFGYLRASIGTGLSITLNPNIRLEATYSVPLLKASHDVIKPFQLGVGVSIN